MTKFFTTLLLLATLASCGKDAARPSEAFALPKNALSESDPRFEKAIEQHMEVQERTLIGLESQSQRKIDSAYHLGAMMFDMGVSLKGVLGQLTGKGSSAVTLIWKKDLPHKESEEATVMPEASAPVLDEAAWNDSVAREFCQQNSCAGGQAPSADLRRHVQGIRDWAVTQAQLEGQFPWKLDRVRLDLQVDASGKVVTDFSPVSLKAAAKLRLEWKKRPIAAKVLAGLPPMPQQRLLGEIMNSLSGLEDEIRREQAMGFQLNSVKIGLGLNLTGEWAVVKPGVTPTLYLYLKPEPGFTPTVVPSRMRAVFRRGFRGAGRMSRFFLRVANRRLQRPAAGWAMTDMKIAFDVSAKRTFTLTSVNSTTGIELHFTKKK